MKRVYAPLFLAALALVALSGAAIPARKGAAASARPPGAPGRPAGRAAATKPAAQARVREAYGRLPLSFEANQGQTDRRVQFLSRGSGYTLFLTPCEAVLALSSPRSHGDTESGNVK